MATNVNSDETISDKCSCFDLLEWLNTSLKTEFNQVEQTCSGAGYCQLMHWLFPKSIDLGKVKFQAKQKEEYIHNYQLLQDSFVKTGVNRSVPVEHLIRGRYKATLDFLKWFKRFFTANHSRQKYNPLAARKGVEIIHARPYARFSQSGKPADIIETVEINSDTDEDMQDKIIYSVYSDEWGTTYNWVKPSNLGKSYAYCSICDINLSIQYTGEFDLKRHQKSKGHNRKQKKVSTSNTNVNDPVSCSAALLQFIQTLDISELSGENEQASHHKSKLVLGPHYPEDITSLCKKTPYCVYLYGHKSVTVGQQTLVVLVGFFDDTAAKHRIRFLDAFQISDNSAEEPVVTFIKETLKKFDLTVQNLCAFYIDGLGEHSEKIASLLRECSPHIVALGGLYSLPDAACHAALTEHFNEAKELILKIHAHFITLSSGDDNLKALFAGVHELDQSMSPQNTLCQASSTLVRRVVGMWQDLLLYFSTDASGEDTGKFEEICTQLKNPKLRVTFIFLDNALEPLRSFQDRLETRNGAVRADLVQILREASGLLRAYASSFLRPQAVIRFLKERDAALLTNPKFYLPTPEQSLGGTAVEDFLLEHKSDMAGSVESFQSKCTSFYATLTGSLARGLPQSDGVLRSMSQLLSPEGRLKVTGKAVEDLAVQLGLTSTPEESLKLNHEFLEYQLLEERKGETNASSGKNGSEDGCPGSSSALSLEEHWGTYLKTTSATSTFRKLMLSLLALPCPPLEAEKVFAQAVGSVDLSHSDDTIISDIVIIKAGLTSDGSHSDSVASPITSDNKKKSPSSRKVVDVTDVVVVEDDSTWPNTEGAGIRGIHGWDSSLRQRPAARTFFQAGTGTWCKPESSEKEAEGPRKTVQSTTSPVKSEPKATVTAIATSTPVSASPRCGKKGQMYQDGHGFTLRELVWGKGKEFSWWPGLVVEWKGRSAPVAMRKVEWFGDGMFSEIHTGGLLPFAAFAKCFCPNSFASLPSYKNAIYQVLELASERSGKSFTSDSGSKEDELKSMLEWAFGGFQPMGPEGFLPPSEDHSNTKDSDSSMSDYQPPAKRKNIAKKKSYSESQGREHILREVSDKGKNIERFCISCGTMDVEVRHPLFEGGLCGKCKKNFSETLYRYDKDGYQAYCTVCCYGLEVILCSNSGCYRCFCRGCVDMLVGPGTFEQLKEVEPWSCYMCLPSKRFGVLKLRVDWNARVQEFFGKNSAFQFVPHRVYPSIPAQMRRPIRVLSLFDGIATGCCVLKELGFNIELYIAADISDDKAVSSVKQDGKIRYIKDVRSITRKNVTDWGPFDLLIGGSPCNDLSTVNPSQKGLFDGIGRLFFEYYRMLTMMRPREDDNRPFFWLYENVVAMSSDDKNDICRFLECNPIMIDTVSTNPAHRVRYFWGNLPGMSRPVTVSHNDKANLQDYLETGQIAKFDNVRTNTTNSNSIKQGKMTMNGKEDQLWRTEMERVFGFSKHCTDVPIVGRGQRQKLLGQSWRVPVIRHLFAPLKNYFACE